MLSEYISKIGEESSQIQVRMANEAVQLLSAQLYQSPTKAVEELVVNSYDALAKECRIYYPSPSDPIASYVVVYDNGNGMDEEGLNNLWQIGRSKKRENEINDKRLQRKQIGKFGVGKLATYVIAYQLTYITKFKGKILSVSVDFRKFSTTNSNTPVIIPVIELDSQELYADEDFAELLDLIDLKPSKLLNSSDEDTWTIAVLESLRPKAQKIRLGTLHWVLRTAMPLGTDFNLYLNGEEIKSSKEDIEPIFEFELSDLGETRLKTLKAKTGDDWKIENGILVSNSFPSGITGTVFMTEKPLRGKSDDLQRSHGFFVRVRKRLINLEDDLFGTRAGSFGTFYRMRADIQVDDLDSSLTASREGAEESDIKRKVRILITEIYNEADVRYKKYLREKSDKEKNKKERERRFVSPRFVEHPIADVIGSSNEHNGDNDAEGSDADETWFFMNIPKSKRTKDIVESLYEEKQRQYQFIYTNMGDAERLVTFNPDPEDLSFVINSDHPLARNYTEGTAKYLLEDFVVAEVLLEIYLREARVAPHVIGEILERRNLLLADLVTDHPMSRKQVAQYLRDSAADQHDLEIALVVAARSLGFVATHVSGAGEPDGLARLRTYPQGEKVITLEAKSSSEIPQLSAIGVDGLAEHKSRHNADGCLVIAPSYPGEKQERERESAISYRARENKISCWTIEILAKFIEGSEARQLTTIDFLNIVLNHYSPTDVESKVSELLTREKWGTQELYRAIIYALETTQDRFKGKTRTIDLLLFPISNFSPNLTNIGEQNVQRAVRELAAASNGTMRVNSDGQIVILTSLDDLKSRTNSLTQNGISSHGLDNFRKK